MNNTKVTPTPTINIQYVFTSKPLNDSSYSMIIQSHKRYNTQQEKKRSRSEQRERKEQT